MNKRNTLKSTMIEWKMGRGYSQIRNLSQVYLLEDLADVKNE